MLDELERRGIANDATIDEFENIPGHGVRATVAGRQVLERPRAIEDQQIEHAVAVEVDLNVQRFGFDPQAFPRCAPRAN